MIDGVPIAIHGDGWTPIEVDLTPILDGRTSFVLGVEARTPDDRSGGRFSVSLAGTGTAFRGESGSRRASRRAIMPTFVHEAKLSRQGLDHGLDFRLHVAGSRRKSPRAPSSAQHRGELTRRRLRRVATTCAVMFGKRPPFRTNGGRMTAQLRRSVQIRSLDAFPRVLCAWPLRRDAPYSMRRWGSGAPAAFAQKTWASAGTPAADAFFHCQFGRETAGAPSIGS